MSRSHKKTPIVKDHDSGRWGKKQANHKVRRHKDNLPNGSSYRKVFNTWDIHDFVSRYSRKQFISDKESDEKHLANGVREHSRLTEYDWAKYYLRK